MSTIQDNEIRNILKKYVASSYVPTVILDSEQLSVVKSCLNKDNLKDNPLFQKMSAETQTWIATAVSTGIYNYIPVKLPSPNFINIKNFISDLLFPGKKLTKLKEDVRTYLAVSEEEYKDYVLRHNELMKQIDSQVEDINKGKCRIKENILYRISKKLSLMGIESEICDYRLESLDKNKFKSNKEFQSIRIEYQEIQKNEFLEDLPEVGYGVANILVYFRAKQIKGQIDDIRQKTDLIFEKMRSDNQKVECMYHSLQNIIDIFTDIKEAVIPCLEEVLLKIETDYHNDFSKIPQDLLCFLRTVTTILKVLSETRILTTESSKHIINATISSSNNMSAEYEKLRTLMAMAAA